MLCLMGRVVYDGTAPGVEVRVMGPGLPDDFRVTQAQRAYLAAFDNWLHTVWKQAPADRPPNDLATGLKNAALADMLRKEAPRAAVRVTSGLSYIGCKRCGGDLPVQKGPGRPRKYCTDCRPVRSRQLVAA